MNFPDGILTATKTKYLQHSISNELEFKTGVRITFGTPFFMSDTNSKKIEDLALSYVALIEAISELYGSSLELQKYLSVPSSFHEMISNQPSYNQLDMCRLDCLLDSHGTIKIMETNANCPGLLLYAGGVAAELRSIAKEALPVPRPFESDEMFGSWFSSWYASVRGKLSDPVLLIREENGHRLELDWIKKSLLQNGIESIEADPRQLQLSPDSIGYLGRKYQAGYHKISLPKIAADHDFGKHIQAASKEAFYIPNMARSRLIADNKLCLAVISDPSFSSLFPPSLMSEVRDAIPWSRNIAFCSASEVDDIAANPESFVLKQPYNTRGQGVYIGREINSHQEWLSLIEVSINENWLVQSFIETPLVSVCGQMRYHDLAVGIYSKKVVGAFSRSGSSLKSNVAQGNTLHPVYI